MTAYLEEIKFNERGLVPVVTIEAETSELLMVAWANKEAISATVEEKRAVYWSRSRSKIWRKGEESGNVQKLVEIRLDCDNDTVCYIVNQIGGAACHTGRKSCFFKRLSSDSWTVCRDKKAIG
ncbi:MAG: phosphoribosyl-AMP cyclohydrolase [Gammaproteobacteria bacterium]|nr:phosphoribosyl-AMP cyclohydrolase [Gammaproteobacteria bacterium]MDG1952361.1 phosphoribosyl-AMP cyclohydrolase [Gammaproteobacteria bacterium]MDG2118483.1 phosphoribosyl-AMP cyclohydrolase [Gammaproteobacteria bacterium]